MKRWGIIVGLSIAGALLAWTFMASVIVVFALGVWADVPWPAKAVMWWPYAVIHFPDPQVNARIAWWCLVSGAIAALPLLLVGKLAVDLTMRRRSKLHGESAFASRAEIERRGVFQLRGKREL